MLPILPPRESALNEIKENDYLSIDTIEKLHEILGRQTTFEPQSVSLMREDLYDEIVSISQPHIQILADVDTEEVGHWICIHYNGDMLYLYDSFNSDHDMNLTYQQLLYIRHLFPARCPPIAYKKVKQQENAVDCGVFAIAFATTLALGLDPCEQDYDTGKMREHLLTILETTTLTPFPVVEKEPVGDAPVAEKSKNISRLMSWSFILFGLLGLYATLTNPDNHFKMNP